ncbi:unnamed protein product [Bursaphelenchus okinawaensis]|uniref:Elongation factor 1 beta central acidic region eukaryote domain-containing protein n=1 Tax=Bursaphelenchus okinawaensis TaxID=465554 RepID=A0A811KZK7_9BILA|nr:unnamed protein product [Bursaphelenchus okinawaensis]CAG9113511.1 unnamed protein product [Bursaphelenchus okinawaensis]
MNTKVQARRFRNLVKAVDGILNDGLGHKDKYNFFLNIVERLGRLDLDIEELYNTKIALKIDEVQKTRPDDVKLRDSVHQLLLKWKKVIDQNLDENGQLRIQRYTLKKPVGKVVFCVDRNWKYEAESEDGILKVGTKKRTKRTVRFGNDDADSDDEVSRKREKRTVKLPKDVGLPAEKPPVILMTSSQEVEMERYKQTKEEWKKEFEARKRAAKEKTRKEFFEMKRKKYMEIEKTAQSLNLNMSNEDQAVVKDQSAARVSQYATVDESMVNERQNAVDDDNASKEGQLMAMDPTLAIESVTSAMDGVKVESASSSQNVEQQDRKDNEQYQKPVEIDFIEIGDTDDEIEVVFESLTEKKKKNKKAKKDKKKAKNDGNATDMDEIGKESGVSGKKKKEGIHKNKKDKRKHKDGIKKSKKNKKEDGEHGKKGDVIDEMAQKLEEQQEKSTSLVKNVTENVVDGKIRKYTPFARSNRMKDLLESPLKKTDGMDGRNRMLLNAQVDVDIQDEMDPETLKKLKALIKKSKLLKSGNRESDLESGEISDASEDDLLDAELMKNAAAMLADLKNPHCTEDVNQTTCDDEIEAMLNSTETLTDIDLNNIANAMDNINEDDLLDVGTAHQKSPESNDKFDDLAEIQPTSAGFMKSVTETLAGEEDDATRLLQVYMLGSDDSNASTAENVKMETLKGYVKEMEESERIYNVKNSKSEDVSRTRSDENLNRGKNDEIISEDKIEEISMATALLNDDSNDVNLDLDEHLRPQYAIIKKAQGFFTGQSQEDILTVTNCVQHLVRAVAKNMEDEC